MLLEGIFPAITTPYYPDERLYLKKLEHNVQRYSRTPVAGLAVLGSTGEAVMLSDDESRTVLKTAREAAAPEKVLLAGVGRESVEETLRLIEYAAEQQYDAALVRTPGFYAPNTGSLEILTYYRTLADRSPLPIVLYNIPKYTHYEIPVEVVAELARHPYIIGIKESSGSVPRIAALVAATRNAPRRQAHVTTVFTAFTTRMMLAEAAAEDFLLTQSNAVALAIAPPKPQAKGMRKKEVGFQVLTGAGHQLLDSLNAGATGGILALAAFAPEGCQEIYAAWKENDTALAEVKQRRVIEPSRIVLAKYGIPGIKHACDLNGYYGGRPRLPLLALNAEQRSEVASAVADVRN